jgi:hypothetical protein
MTSSPDMTGIDEYRINVIRGQVACPRVGPVALDRCRECTYLVRLEDAAPDRAGGSYVVCSRAAVVPRSDLTDGWW